MIFICSRVSIFTFVIFYSVIYCIKKIQVNLCYDSPDFLWRILHFTAPITLFVVITTEGTVCLTSFGVTHICHYEEWICGIFTKTIYEAKNRNQLLNAVQIAESLGLKENEDFFLIKDCCLTELVPEEVGEDGIGRTLTCIGFRPLPDGIAHQISRRYQLYK